MRLLFRHAVIAIACGGLALAPARAAETVAPADATSPAALKICLDENLPPFSARRNRSGFDVALADALGQNLGQPVTIRWFESQLDSDKSLSVEANALLSDGLCDLVGNFPLTEDTLEQPHIADARLPDFDGAKPADRRRRVALGTLIASAPVRYDTLTVAFGPNARTKTVHGLADLAGLKIGIDSGTFADFVLMKFDHGRLADDITHVVPGRGHLMEKVDAGEFDATLVDLGRLDGYRANHPDTKITPSGFYYRIGFNMGFVALSTQAGLIDRVNRALSDLHAKGTIEALAKSSGITWLAPHEPAISKRVLINELEN